MTATQHASGLDPRCAVGGMDDTGFMPEQGMSGARSQEHSVDAMHLGTATRGHTDFCLDVDYLAGRSVGILGKKGAGKTFTMRVMVEEFYRAGVQTITVDPVGVFWGLRLDQDGTSPGLNIAIYGGSHGDRELSSDEGFDMANHAIHTGESMILDLSEFTSRDQERVFVRDFLDQVYRGNKDRSLLHVLLDEADLWAPQKTSAKDAPLLEVMQNLVRRGRNFGIGTTLATQRPAVLSKDVLTQVDALAVLRLIASHDQDAIRAWVEGQDNSEAWGKIEATLSTLNPGEAWWWVPENSVLERMQMRHSSTYDSSPTRTRSMDARLAPRVLPMGLGVAPGPSAAPVDHDGEFAELAAMGAALGAAETQLQRAREAYQRLVDGAHARALGAGGNPLGDPAVASEPPSMGDAWADDGLD